MYHIFHRASRGCQLQPEWNLVIQYNTNYIRWNDFQNEFDMHTDLASYCVNFQVLDKATSNNVHPKSGSIIVDKAPRTSFSAVAFADEGLDTAVQNQAKVTMWNRCFGIHHWKNQLLQHSIKEETFEQLSLRFED